MPTITMARRLGGAQAPSSWTAVKTIHTVDFVVDLADVITAKGSALIATDVIEALNVPNGFMIVAAGMEKMTATVGTSADATFSLGITGVNAAAYASGYILPPSPIGTVTSISTQPHLVQNVNDTIDLLLTAFTGTLTGGRIRVWAVLADTRAKPVVGLAAIGS